MTGDEPLARYLMALADALSAVVQHSHADAARLRAEASTGPELGMRIAREANERLVLFLREDSPPVECAELHGALLETMQRQMRVMNDVAGGDEDLAAFIESTHDAAAAYQRFRDFAAMVNITFP